MYTFLDAQKDNVSFGEKSTGKICTKCGRYNIVTGINFPFLEDTPSLNGR
jgi:hypothetical protein